MRFPSFALIACLLAGCADSPKGVERTEATPAMPQVRRVRPAWDAPGVPMVRMMPPPQPDPAAESEADRATRRLLDDKVIDNVSFNGDSLETALNFVRDTTGANMVVSWGAIEAAGLKKDKAVTHSLKQVTAAALLKVVMENASMDLEGDNRLGYAIEDGIIKVSTIKELKKTTVEKAYDIRELLVQAPDFTDAPEFSLAGSLHPRAECHIFDSGPEKTSESTLLDELTTRIKEHVGTKSEWDDNLSVMSYFHGQLLVKTTRENHRAIPPLLADIRRAKGLTVALQARVLRMPAAELEKLSVRTGGTLELPPDAVAALMARAADKDSGIQILATARQRCMNGQRTHVAAGVEKAFVSDVSAPAPAGRKITEEKETADKKDGKTIKETKTTDEPVATATPPALRATLGTIQDGLAADTEVTISADHRQVATTVRADFAVAGPLRQAAVLGGAQIEVPELALWHWRTTTPIPNGGAVLLTAAGHAKPGENAMETVLLLQATVVEPQGR